MYVYVDVDVDVDVYVYVYMNVCSYMCMVWAYSVGPTVVACSGC